MSEILSHSKTFEFVRLPGRQDSIHPSALSEIMEHTATRVGSKVVLLGTLTATDPGGELCIWDYVTGEWVWFRGRSFTNHETVLADDCLLVYGNSSSRPTEEVWKVDLTSLSISCLRFEQALPVAQKGFTADYIEKTRQVLTFGGLTLSGYSNLLLLIHIDTLEWTEPMQVGRPPCPRNGQASCSLANRRETTVFYYGGDDGGNFFNDLHILNFSTETKGVRWSSVEVNDLCEQVAYCSLSLVGKRLVVFGGILENLDDTDMLVLYDIEEDTWHDLHNDPEYEVNGDIAPNSGHRAVSFNQGILFIGGFNIPTPWIDIFRVEA